LTPSELKTARKALGLTQSGLAEALRLSPKNGDRSVRIWETEGNTIPGPVQVAVECLLHHGKRRGTKAVKEMAAEKPTANPQES